MKDFVQRPMSRWLCVALALLALVLQGGCGGCSSLNKRRQELIEAAEAAARQEAEEEKKEREAWQQTMAARRAEEDRRKAEEKEKQAAKKKQQEEEEEQSKLPPLPADFSQWKEEHFLQSLATANPQLLKALEHRAKAPQRTAAEAGLLISLLAPPQQRHKPNATPVSNHPSRHASYSSIDRASLVRAVAAALAANGTAEARQALGQLLGGQVAEADPQAAAEGAFAALLRDSSAESQQLVFKAVTAPIDAQQSASGGAGAAMDSARQRMIALLGAEGSRQLRASLARWAVEEAAPGPVRDAVVKMLCEPNWLNLDAQMLLYGSPVCDAAACAALERQMLVHSGEALGVLLELGSGEVATDGQQRTLGSQGVLLVVGSPVEKHYAVARNLWHPRFAELLELRMQAVGSLREASSLVNLAATVPTSAMRDRLRRTLHRHWWEGPQVLGGAETYWPSEPGLVPVLKLLQRQNAAGGLSAGGRPGRAGGNGRSPAYGGRSGSQPGEKSAAAAAEPWNRYLEGFVRNLCRRCHLAALQQAAAAHRSGAGVAAELDPEDLGFPQFPGAQLQAVFRIDFPGKHAVELPDLADDFLRLRYVRMELTAIPNRAAAYYRRQMTQCWERSWPDGLWLDSLQLLPEKAGTRSVDVILTLPKGAIGSASDTLPLTVEVLVVEITDSSQGQVRTK